LGVTALAGALLLVSFAGGRWTPLAAAGLAGSGAGLDHVSHLSLLVAT
jgi:hypothetical protein